MRGAAQWQRSLLVAQHDVDEGVDIVDVNIAVARHIARDNARDVVNDAAKVSPHLGVLVCRLASLWHMQCGTRIVRKCPSLYLSGCYSNRMVAVGRMVLMM